MCAHSGSGESAANSPLHPPDTVLAQVVAIAADAIVSVDEHERIILFNEGAEQIFGYAADEVLGDPLDVLIPDEFRQVHHRHLRAFLHAPEVARRMGERRRVSGRRRNGQVFPAEASISKVCEQGKWFLTVVLRDISERVEATRKLKRLLQEARSATEARDQVLRVVSHDLRNPIHTASLTADLMLELAPPAERRQDRKHLGILKRSLAQADRLIRDLLEVESIEQGRFRLNLAALDPETLVHEAEEDFRALVENAGLEWVCEVAPNAPVVRADEGRVVQILGNLVVNAVKFTPRGGHVNLRVDPEREAGNDRATAARFSVADTGPGIPPEQMDQLFTSFWQADPDDPRGIGLGLTIAARLVEAHGGRIWVESQIERGSTFHFTLPAWQGELPG